jgi:hypothetical protein
MFPVLTGEGYCVVVHSHWDLELPVSKTCNEGSPTRVE